MAKQKKKSTSKFQTGGIGLKITTQFSALIAAIILVLGIIFVTSSKKILVENTYETMQTMTTQAGHLANAEIEKYIAMGESLAQSRLLDDKVPLEERMAELDRNAEFYGHTNIGIGDMDGEFVFNNGDTLNLKDKDFFEKAAEGEVEVSEPTYSEEIGQTVITYAIPVKCLQDGDVEQVLVFNRPGDEMNKIINEISFLKTGQAFMVDEHGCLIADKNQELVLNDTNLTDLSNGVTSESLATIVKEMTAGKTGVGEYTINGQKKAVSYAPVGDTTWSIGISVEYSDILNGANKMQMVIILLGILITGVTVILSIRLSKNLTGDINVISEKIRDMGNGDFTVEIDDKIINRHDEIGVIAHSCNELKNSIGSMIMQVKELGDTINKNSSEILEFSEELSASTSDISSSISEVSQGNSKQSEEITDIALETEEASKRIDNLYENASVVQNNTMKIEENAEKSKVIVDDMENLINKFGNRFELFRENVDELGNDMNTINSITNIINGISEQTNLLALNAAIEAARAGEMGRGFAVVADEIRILAEQSKQNSEEITKIIVKSSNNTKAIVDQTSEISNGLIEQTQQIKNVKEAFDDIAVSVENVIPELDNVQKEFDFVQKGQKGIARNIENLSAVSEQVAASSQEILASSEELNESSGDLTTLAQKLNNSVDSIMGELNKFRI